MPDYATIYTCTFDPVMPESPTYTLTILKKDFVGDSTAVIGSTVPVIHSWPTDDPKAPVRGSSLTASLINQNGSLPLSSFFSTDDDEFKVWFNYGAQRLFEGFLVQDDCSETLLDSTHEINLSATDNLGLLKDVPLDKARIIYDDIGTVNDTWDTTAPHTLTIPVGISALLHPGDQVFIHHPIFDITYNVTDNVGGNVLIVAETVTTTSFAASDIHIMHPRGFDDKVTIAFILSNCLWATGLELNTWVWGKIIEQSQNDTTSFIDQTLEDPQTFLKNDTEFQDCYTCLEMIFKSFKMCLFQAKGVWNIMRWDELRYYSNAMDVYIYDTDFTMTGTDTMDDVFTIEPNLPPAPRPNMSPETELRHSAKRGFTFVKETFNYKTPVNLLRNWNLQILGNLLNTTTTGTGITLQTTREYEFPWWIDAVPPYDTGTGTATYFIRVVSDYLDNELDRYLFLKDNNIVAYRIEVNKGDRFEYSYQMRTADSQSGGTGIQMFGLILLTDGVTDRFGRFPPGSGDTEPGWGTVPKFHIDIDSGDNTNQWHSMFFGSGPIPYDGLLYCFLIVNDFGGTDNGTLFKDLRFDYTAFINDSTKIIGQTHNSSQIATIKQNENEEIMIDTSTRNAIAGTLFLDSTTGVLQDRAAIWGHPYLTQAELLGNIITFEQLFWRRVPRTILEGTFYGLTQSAIHVSLLSVFKYTFFPTLNLVPGMMEIDYRNNKFTGTLWEIWEDSETDADLNSTYEFKYLYSTK